MRPRDPERPFARRERIARGVNARRKSGAFARDKRGINAAKGVRGAHSELLARRDKLETEVGFTPRREILGGILEHAREE
jgi:hypothetical protein